jgi:Tfp pilus assembly protein PilO
MNDRRQLTIAAVGTIGITLLFFVFAFKPKIAQISETKKQVEAAEQEERDLRNKLKDLRDIQKGSLGLAAQLQAVAGFLPSTPDLPDFIRLVQTAATKSGADLRSIAPSPPTDRSGATGIQEITVTLVAAGGFHRIQDFLARLERLPRIVLVNALALNPTTDPLSGLTILNTTITLKMFVVQPTAKLTGSSGSSTTASPSPTAEAS